MALRDQTDQQDNPLAAIVYSAGTDVGMRREENQDSYGIIAGERFRLYIVADGMGGVQGGAIASNLAIGTIENFLKNHADCSQVDLVKAASAANEAIHIRGKDDPALVGMGTTLVGVLFTPEAVRILHVGDSRAYLIRSGEISQLTEDHTLVQELVRSGAITEEQAQHHPVSHMLTRSMGPSPQIEIDCEILPGGAKPGDMFLLCSDGLYNLVKAPEIAEIVSSHNTDDAVQLLIDLANERGGSDNITVMIISVGDQYGATPMGGRDDEEVEQDDYLIEELDGDESVPAAPVQHTVQKLMGGYHEAGEVAEDPDLEIDVENDPETFEPSEELKAFEEAFPDADAADAPGIEHPEVDQPYDGPGEEGDSFDEMIDEEPIDGDLAVTSPPAPVLSRMQNRLPLLAGGFAGGIFVAYLLFGGRPEIPVSTTTVTAKRSERPLDASPVAPERPAQLSGEPAPSEMTTVYSTPFGVSAEQDLEHVLAAVIPASERIGPAEKSSIIKRKRDLEALLVDVNGKLGQFDRPLSGEIGEMLRGSTKRAEEIRSKLDQIKADIDVATRKLAVWYDRRRRLQTTDAINMASEIAAAVPAVKQKKEEFERATWDYLKEVEALRYSPGSRERETHVSELVKIRAVKMKELAAEVRASIDRALSDADHGIADLTLQRSQLEASLESIKGDMEFVRTITGSDTVKKRELKEEILRRREGAMTELEELNKLLPEPSTALNQ